MKKLELILITGAIIGFLMAVLNVPHHTFIASVFLLILGVMYLYLGFALFNDIPFRKIFKTESYRSIGPWRIGIAVGTGLGLSQLTVGFMLTMSNYPLTRSFLTFGLVLTALMLLLALIRNTKEKHQSYRNIALRCAVFIIIAIIFLIVHGQQGPAA